MASSEDFRKLTESLGEVADCPACGADWLGCMGACVAHGGPYHQDYGDDCPECRDEDDWHGSARRARMSWGDVDLGGES